MSTVLEYPQTELAETDYHAFNLAVWERLQADPVLADLDYRIETDRHGQLVMSRPPPPPHGNKQGEIARCLGNLRPGGKIITECPITTREGVKVVDIAWCSNEVWERLGGRTCFFEAPEICVEVVSPGNTRGELAEKKMLYFEEGAREVWFCDREGRMAFSVSGDDDPRKLSGLVPGFPLAIE